MVSLQSGVFFLIICLVSLHLVAVVKRVFTCVHVIQCLSPSVLLSGRLPGRSRSLPQSELSSRLQMEPKGFERRNAAWIYVWDLWMTQGLKQSVEWWKVGNFSSSKVLLINSLLFSLEVLTTGSAGAEQLDTSWIYLFMSPFLYLSQRLLFPVIPICVKCPLGKAIQQLRSTEVQRMENGPALLVGIKQWHVYGWNKYIWNVCL